MIKLYENCFSIKEICRKNAVTKSALYNWIPLYKKHISNRGLITTLRKAFLLEKRVAYLTRQNEIFSESGCAAGSPLNQKLDAVARLKDRYNIRILCDTLQVKRSAVYHHLYHRPQQTQNMQQDEFLRPMIREIFEQSKCRLGTKKIRAKLDEMGINTSARRISHLMKEMDLSCSAPITKRNYPKESMRQYSKNKLNQQFNQAAPNQAWVSDITCVKSNSNKYYICVIIDLFARKVLAHEVSQDMPVSFVSSTFLKAYVRRGCPQSLVFHSDQGAQYTSYPFGKLLEELKVAQSFSKPGCPFDNAVAESFFSMLKKEELNRGNYTSLCEVRRAVDEYIDFYNDERPHQSLSYATPTKIENQFYERTTAIV